MDFLRYAPWFGLAVGAVLIAQVAASGERPRGRREVWMGRMRACLGAGMVLQDSLMLLRPARAVALVLDPVVIAVFVAGIVFGAIASGRPDDAAPRDS